MPGLSPNAPLRGPVNGDRQQGVVLLALLLVVLVGSSYVLLGKLNRLAQDTARDVQTQKVLKQAKKALIDYAVNYPELHEDSDRIPGPGYLPCPDQDPGADLDPDAGETDFDEDMVGQTNCTESTGTTVGRLPTRDLGLDNLVDAAGERLWYAVAQEYKHNQTSDHVLNSETPASLRLDGDDEQIVAVIIAPGAPIAGQDGRDEALADLYVDNGTPATDWYQEVSEYLEDDNATNGDGAYVSAPTATGSPTQCTDNSLDDDEIESQCFNDQVVTITRAELMSAVEARVANDVRAALESWRNDVGGGAYPWLQPYVDPRRDGRYGASLGGYGLSGRDNRDESDSGSLILQDSYADFVTAGVAAGDRVWNVSDGSFGTVASLTTTTVTVSALEGGTADVFDTDDIYYIEAAALNLGTFAGVAEAASGGTMLDADADLESMGVVPGDVIDNLTDGTSGSVVSTDGDEVTLDSGSGVQFDSGDSWRVRSAFGAVSAAGTTTLVDAAVDFTALGVTAGDLVRNLTDGSQGVVATVGVPDDQTLTVTSLYGGTDNTFAANDSYALVRHLPASGTRYGLLPVHEMGKPFSTDFSIKWSLTSANGNTISPTALADLPTGSANTYYSGIRNWIQQSTLYSDATGSDDTYPDAVSLDTDLACIWVGAGIAHCSGKYTDSAFLTARVESVSLSGSIYTITDTGTRFNRAGVRPGAKVRNLTQSLDGVVHAASSLTQNNVNVVAVDDGGTPFTAVEGDIIRIWVAAKRTPVSGSWTADAYSVANQVCATGADFWSFVGAGDAIRLNSSTWGNPVGLITGVPSADCVSYTDLQGGTTTSIAVGDSFRILYDYVETRKWEVKVRMAGTAVASSPAAGYRERSVCQGFGSDCATQNADPLYVADNTNPVVTFSDYDAADNLLGTASVTIPAGGAAQGSLVVSGIDLLMDVDEDDSEIADSDDGNLPRWFLRNRWHEYLFVSYANALTPTEVALNLSSDCVAGTDCLTEEVPVGVARNDRKAVVVAAGAELDSQNRGNGTFVSYFEDENADADTGDPSFERADTDSTFNDQLSAVTP
jgi:hypothetical protein